MKILLYDNSGHPFQVQLSRALAMRGYQVLHIYSAAFQTPKGKLVKTNEDPKTFFIKGLKLSSPFKKYSFLKRWIQENQFGKLVVNEIKNYNPDVLIASNVPLDTLKHVQSYCAKNRIRLVFWVQDFYGIAIKNILKKKLSVLGSLIGNYYIRLEANLLNKSDFIVLITHHFIDVLKQMSVKNKKFTVIPNWAPLDELSVVNKKNDWSISNNLEDKFCFMYTGTLGLKHRPELLLNLAVQFQNYPDVIVVVISEGLGADWLSKKKEEYSLKNLLIMNFQPYELLSSIMGSADVLISILEKDAGIYSVPSKILSYMCASRPLLLSVPKENLASIIVKESDCGIVTGPANQNEFIEAAMNLYKDSQMRINKGRNARNYAAEHFQINSITKKFIDIINN